MGIQLADLRKDSRIIEVEVFTGGDEPQTLKVTYSPSKITPDFDRALEKAREDRAWGVTFVAEAVTKWDLLDGDVMYPLTREAVGKLPDYLIGKVITGVLDDMGKARAVSSDSLSQDT